MQTRSDLLQETSHMDRLTQTQDAIDDLIKIMFSTLSYLTRKADFKQVNSQIPINRPAPESDPPELFAANQKELVADFLTKAKQLEYLISVLPKPILAGPGSMEDESELEELQAELEIVNREYLEAVAAAEGLHEELMRSLKIALEGRAVLPE